MLGVDALVACDRDLNSRHLAELEGFSWMGFGDLSDLNQYADRPIGLAAVHSDRGERVVLPQWDDGDDLSLLRSVLYGRIIGESAHERHILDKLAPVLSRRFLEAYEMQPSDTPWPMGPLEHGMWAAEYLTDAYDDGVAVINFSCLSDIVRFWNLRALGNRVLPWPEPSDERIEMFTRVNLDSLRTVQVQPNQYHTTIFTNAPEAPKDLLAIIQRLRPGAVHMHSLDFDAYIPPGAGITSRFAEYFEVGTDMEPRGKLTARVPLPPHTGLAAEFDPEFGRQFGAARVVIHSERGIGERVSFRAPGIRKLAKHLRWAVDVSSPIVRGVADGLVVAYPANAKYVVLGAISSVELIKRLFEAAGVQVAVSEAGRWTARIVDMLGGASSVLAAQPSVRQVLDLAAREGGANAEELHNAARRAAGNWEQGSKLWRGQEDYHRWVVKTLAARQLIDASLTYTCRACGLLQRMAPQQVQPTLSCNDCEHEVPLGLQVVVEAAWRLKARRLLTQTRLRSVFPIAASLLLFRQLESRAGDVNLQYCLGLDLKYGGRDFEVDYAVLLHDDRGPALVIGESKARKDFDDNDIANLEAVQEAIRSSGVECFIAASNSKDQLTWQEIRRLRRAADRCLPGLNSDTGSRSYLNLPLVLTKSTLTQPEFDSDHPLSQAGTVRPTIDELAKLSSVRELGLEDRSDSLTSSLRWSKQSK